MTLNSTTGLKVELVRRGLKQIDVALELAIERARFNQIVNGRIEPSTEERRRIAAFLGCSQASLFGARAS